MAAGDIRDMFGGSTALTITLASLANGAARQSTMVDNSTDMFQSALIFVKMTSGATAPTGGTTYTVHLIRRDDHASPNIADDNAAGSDAAIILENAPILGAVVLTNTSAKAFYGVFDTSTLGPLGKSWGIAIKNNSGQTVSTTPGDHSVRAVGKYANVE
jgi:hypothetical protein